MIAAPPPALPRRHSRSGIAYALGGSGGSAGAPVLLLHGVGLSADCWQAQITALQAQWRVFALDLPGHGESAPFSDNSPQMSDFTAKIADFIESEIGEAVALVGHSLGALIALHTAARAPKWVRRAALLSPVYQRDDAAQRAVAQRAEELRHAQDTARRAALIDATLKRWFGDPPAADAQEAAAACRHWLHRTPPAAYAAAYCVFAAAGAEAAPLQNITQPLLYITGDADANSTAEMSRALAAKSTASADARAEVVAGHAHMLQLTAAAQVNALLAQWLRADNRQSAA